MVLEDYGELMFLQTVLKKIGFDVDAIQNPRSFQDSVLRMNPDVLVMTSVGKRVKGYDLASGLKRPRGTPKIILIQAPNAPEIFDPQVDGWLKGPVAALDLLNTIGDLCGLDKAVLAEKFQKLKLTDPNQPEAARVLHHDKNAGGAEMVKSEKAAGNFGVLQDSTVTPSQRQDRYKKVLEKERPEHIGFSVKKVQDLVKSLRKEENVDDLAELERQRKAFVENLFKKKA